MQTLGLLHCWEDWNLYLIKNIHVNHNMTALKCISVAEGCKGNPLINTAVQPWQPKSSRRINPWNIKSTEDPIQENCTSINFEYIKRLVLGVSQNQELKGLWDTDSQNGYAFPLITLSSLC